MKESIQLKDVVNARIALLPCRRVESSSYPTKVEPKIRLNHLETLANASESDLELANKIVNRIAYSIDEYGNKIR